MLRLQTFFFACLVLFFSQLGVAAQQSAAELDALEARLAKYSSFQADFKQTTLDAQGQLLQSLTGMIKMQKPGELYWKANDPYPQLLVSDGKSIWQYDEDLEQVVVQDYQKQLDNMSFLQLLERPSLIKQHFVLESYSNEKSVAVYKLKASDAAAPVQSVVFEFTDGGLSVASFVDSLKQITTMQFEKLVINQPIPAKWFRFDIPDGADVIHQ